MTDRVRIFDLDGTMRRLGGDRSLFRDIARFFLEDTPGMMAQTTDAIRSQDAEAVAHWAHSLKGLALNFGAEQASAAAFALECSGRSGDLSSATAQFAELEREVARLRTALEPYAAATGTNGSSG